ncbi:unnamed protein product [Brassica rapa]|uniref:Uncharacterized protein n=1 Tax=Brassica campestris TaxID=3711 RepID=A0A8D9GUX4_BRACM|nr:unnamed protein product [Brassica rapa]
MHLVSLIRYCNEESKMNVVYEYMKKGMLKDHLSHYTLRVKSASGTFWVLYWRLFSKHLMGNDLLVTTENTRHKIC